MSNLKAAILNAALATSGRAAAPAATQFHHWVAVGDPQTTLENFLKVLDHNGLLSQAGWIRADAHLVVLGDYFDFGGADARHKSAEEGLHILSFLAAHSPSQVTLILGNHDLARVGELMTFDDERFLTAHVEAARLYAQESASARQSVESSLRVQERSFFEQYPEAATTEVLARDFCSFTAAQRELVIELLDTRRLQVAADLCGLLLCHAGVTNDDLALCADLLPTTPAQIALALNDTFQTAYDSWDRKTPLSVSGLHTPGSFAGGEGGGIFFHRAAHPQIESAKDKPGRRYDPRKIPLGVTQVVGHVRDKKCRQLFGDWVVDTTPAQEGQLRCLWTDGTVANYQIGIRDVGAAHGALIFVDGGINYVPPEKYQLLDLKKRADLTPL